MIALTRFWLWGTLGAAASAISCFAAAPPKPKLVVGIIVDQFRYDYLTRFRSDYHGGFDQLLTNGADFTNAFYAQVPTVTAVGHSIFMSGAMPAVSGIVGNAWYDREERKSVTSVCDAEEKIVGGRQPDAEKNCTDADPASPRRLLVTTVGDELRVNDARSKVVGVSIKARGAILPSGHRAAGAYWFDDSTGNFVTSTYYGSRLPAWASKFNDRKLAAEYVDRKWEGFPAWDFHSTSKIEPYKAIPASPWGNELIEQFAEEALTGEHLGTRGVTDLLTVSFSSNDYVGHRVGPDAPEVKDMAIRTDQLLAKLFRRIDQTVGLKNTVIVLSADHGVSATVESDKADRMPGGLLKAKLQDAVQAALNKSFEESTWLTPEATETTLYFQNDALLKAKWKDGKHATEEEVFEVAKEALFATPESHVSQVYSRHQVENGLPDNFISRAVANGYYPRRSGDLFLIFEPGFLPSTTGTSHFSPYSYDRHVPVLFMGPGIKAGRYNTTIQPNDIAPTLATMLDIQTPSGSSGRVLAEMLLN